MVPMNFYQCWKAKLEKPHFFKVQSGKITLCNRYIFYLKYRPASIVDFNMTLLPLMPNIDTDQAVFLEEKKFLKRDGNSNSIMVTPYLSELGFFPSLKPTGYFCQL